MKLFIYFLMCPICVVASEYAIDFTTNRFSVSFADASLTDFQKSTISADLQHEYLTLTNCPITVSESGTHGYLDFAAYGTEPYLTGIRLPSMFEILPSGNRIIEVDKKLSDSYKDALSLISANAGVYEQGRAFVSSLRNGLLSSITSNEVSQVFYSQKAVSEESAEKSRDELSHYLDGYDLLDPGVLSFGASSEFLSDGSETFFMIVPYVNIGDSGKHGAFPAVWTDGRWKLFLWCP